MSTLHSVVCAIDVEVLALRVQLVLVEEAEVVVLMMLVDVDVELVHLQGFLVLMTGLALCEKFLLIYFLCALFSSGMMLVVYFLFWFSPSCL